MTRKFEGADQESLDLLKKMKDRGIESSYDRYDAQRMQTRLRRGILSVMLLPCRERRSYSKRNDCQDCYDTARLGNRRQQEMPEMSY